MAPVSLAALINLMADLTLKHIDPLVLAERAIAKREARDKANAGLAHRRRNVSAALKFGAGINYDS